MDARPYFWLLNSTGKIMICSTHNQVKFLRYALILRTYTILILIRTYTILQVSYNKTISFILRYFAYHSFEVTRCRPFR